MKLPIAAVDGCPVRCIFDRSGGEGYASMRSFSDQQVFIHLRQGTSPLTMAGIESKVGARQYLSTTKEDRRWR
jgi:hypothetical protein